MKTELLFQRPIAYHPIVAKATESVKLTVLWCQINYWTDKARDPEGWVYKTQKDIFDETGLSRKEQETARDIGARLGVLMSDVRGSPPTVHFKVDLDRMIEIVERYLAKNEKPAVERKAKKENSIEWVRDMSEDEVRSMAGAFKVSVKCVKERAQDVIDYCESSGKRYKNYKAALRNFIKMHVQRHPDSILRDTERTVIVNTTDAPVPEMTEEQRKKAGETLDKMRADLARKKSMKQTV